MLGYLFLVEVRPQEPLELCLSQNFVGNSGERPTKIELSTSTCDDHKRKQTDLATAGRDPKEINLFCRVIIFPHLIFSSAALRNKSCDTQFGFLLSVTSQITLLVYGSFPRLPKCYYDLKTNITTMMKLMSSARGPGVALCCIFWCRL